MKKNKHHILCITVDTKNTDLMNLPSILLLGYALTHGRGSGIPVSK